MASSRPKLLVGTAKVVNGAQPRGQFLVYQLKQNSVEFDPVPYKSEEFAFPVRCIASLDKR
jgi:hypothetical protein